VFNVLGVALLLPATPALVRRLGRFFSTAAEEEARPVHLDRNVLATPVLAIHALIMELNRARNIALRLAVAAVGENPSMGRIARDQAVLENLVESSMAFANQIQRSSLPSDVTGILPVARRAARDLVDMAELAMPIAKARASLAPIENKVVARELNEFRKSVQRLLNATATSRGESSPDAEELLRNIGDDYAKLKELLVNSVQDEQLPMRTMLERLDLIRDLHRIALQSESAARRLSSSDAERAGVD
jgi:phosphate:Na+ symporter